MFPFFLATGGTGGTVGTVAAAAITAFDIASTDINLIDRLTYYKCVNLNTTSFMGMQHAEFSGLPLSLLQPVDVTRLGAYSTIYLYFEPP